MKSTGMVRAIDMLGRFVIPKEIRDNLDLSTGDPVEIFVEGDRIVLKKHAPCCIFCGKTDSITLYRDKLICSSCLQDLAALPESNG